MRFGRALRAGLSSLRDRAKSAFVSTKGFNPSRIELRPDHKGEFDELFARFKDGGVFFETMNDSSIYVDFHWDDGRHGQLWISASGRSKLRYYHEIDDA